MKSGQSLMELLIAIAVGVIMIGAAAVVIVPALKTNVQTNEAKVGGALGRGLLENARVFAENNWHNIDVLPTGENNPYHLTTSSSPFAIVAGTELIIIATTTYTRYFYIEDVCRIVTGSGVEIPDDCPADFTDFSTKKLTVVYFWEPENASKTFSTHLTRFRSRVLTQIDWSGGPGEEGPVTSTNNRFSTSTDGTDYRAPGAIDFATTSPGSIMLFLE